MGEPFEDIDQITLWVMERTWSEQIRFSREEDWKVKVVWTGQKDFPHAWTVWNSGGGIEDTVWLSFDMINTVTRKGSLGIRSEKRKGMEMIIGNGDKICMIVAEKWTHRLWAMKFRKALFTGDVIVLDRLEEQGLALQLDRDDKTALMDAIRFCVRDDGEREGRG